MRMVGRRCGRGGAGRGARGAGRTVWAFAGVWVL